MEFDNVFEQKVLSIPEVFVYKVPPLRSASGHRAEDWSLDSPIFTGCLRCYQADTKLRIVLYSLKDTANRSVADDNVIEFAECPIEVKAKETITSFVDAVIDSSRYYVLRVKDPRSSRTTMIGIGFRERESAFDFKSVLNDYLRYVDRMELASMSLANDFKKRVEGDSEEEDENNELTHGSSAASVPSKDLSIKSGEKIKVLVPVRGSRAKVASETTGTGTENAVSKGPISVGNRNGTTLLPPPSAAKLLPPPQGGSAPVVISNGHLPPPPHVDHFADLYSESTPVNVSSISMSTQGNVPIYSNTDTIITGSTDAKVPDSEDWGDFEAA